MTRPDLAAVRTQYQVPNDEMIGYQPRVFGSVDIPFSEIRLLTKTEGDLLDRLTLDRGMVGLRDFRDIAQHAKEEAVARYPDNVVPKDVPAERAKEWQGNDGHRDAFRHAYWNAQLTSEFGADWTRAYTTAHEGVPGNPANREAMDLYNNSIGIQIAEANPKATPEDLSKLVQQAVTDGKMIVMDGKGDMEWSDRVPVGQHGLSPKDVIAPHKEKPVVVPTHSAATEPQKADTAYAELSPHAQNLLQDSEQQVRQLAQRHGIGWNQGLDNTVAAVAQKARTDGLTGINRFNVRDGEIRFGQYDGYTLTEGRLDARVAANTPAAESHEKLEQVDQAMTRQADNAPAQAQGIEPPSMGAVQRAA